MNRNITLAILAISVSIVLISASATNLKFDGDLDLGYGEIKLYQGGFEGSWSDLDGNEISAIAAGLSSSIVKTTSTQIPTDSPTLTATPTNTLTPTPTITNTPYVASRTPSTTPKFQQCGRIDLVDASAGLFAEGYYAVVMRIQNKKNVSTFLTQARIAWEEETPERMLWAMRFNDSEWEIYDEPISPVSWTPAAGIELFSGTMGDYIALFKPAYEPLVGSGVVELTFDGSCVTRFVWNISSAAETLTREP